MRVRRIRLTLPSRLRDTAAADARQIAQAVARALQEGGSAPIDGLRVEGAGRSAAPIAMEIESRLRPTGGVSNSSGED